MKKEKKNKSAIPSKEKSTPDKSGKIRLWIMLTAVVLCIIGVFVILFTQNTNDRTVACVNGVPIDIEEFKIAAEHERTDILTRLTNEWNIEADSNFWNTEHNGITPAQILENQALDTIIRMKLEQNWMAEYGILKNTDYKSFSEECKTENKRRQEAKQRGEVFYGPEKFTEIQYYFYRQDKKRAELQNRLSEKELASDLKEQMEYYENNDSSFLLKDGIKKPFEEVQGVILKRLTEIKYEKAINQKTADAEISVNHRLLNKIHYG